MPKKKAKKKSRSNPPALVGESSSVTIRKASNGYVVSSYTPKGEKTYIAKNSKEVKKYADELLGGK